LRPRRARGAFLRQGLQWGERHARPTPPPAPPPQTTAAALHAQVNAETSPKRLFDILEDMIKPFGDAHTSIDAPQLKREF
jgi:hypothetical protein